MEQFILWIIYKTCTRGPGVGGNSIRRTKEKVNELQQTKQTSSTIHQRKL